MGRADRAEASGQLALHRVAHSLRECGDDGENGPQPGGSHRAFSRWIMTSRRTGPTVRILRLL
jgi:hypothetical protein